MVAGGDVSIPCARLKKYDAACLALSQAKAVDEVKEIREKTTIYFIQNIAGCVKIGMASDVRHRLQSLQSANSHTLRLIRTVAGGRPTERWLHRRFSGQRVRGEWFIYSPEMLTVITPDESTPPPPPRPPRMSPAEAIQDADQLGLLTARMRKEYAPFLSDIQQRGSRQ